MGGRFDGTVTPVNFPPQETAGLWWAPEIRRYRFTRAPPRVFSRRVEQAPQKRTSWLDTDNLLRIRPLPANNPPRRPFRLVTHDRVSILAGHRTPSEARCPRERGDVPSLARASGLWNRRAPEVPAHYRIGSIKHTVHESDMH